MLNEPASTGLNEPVYYTRYLIYHVRYFILISDKTSFIQYQISYMMYKNILKGIQDI